MTETQITNYLEGLEQKLIAKSNRQPIDLDLPWIKTLKNLNTSGVYLFFEDNKPCYVGETGNLKKRMNDLRNTKNHTLRRNFGHKYFFNHNEFFKATSKLSFNPEIEILLEKLMNEKLSVSLLPVEFGRKEFEEFICSKYELLNKYNLRSKRK